MPAIGRWLALVGLLAVATPRLGLGQQSAAVRATVRVVASVTSEHRALVAELARQWGRRGALVKVQGSLALVRLRVVGAAKAGGWVASAKPAAIVDIHYLRN